jgi:hypothetical protein
MTSIATLLLIPAAALGQGAARCPDRTVFFEFQVERAAAWIVDSTLDVHPMPDARSPRNLVQFQVDTAGVPRPLTFKVLKVSDSALVLEARRSLAKWRFKPAVRYGCRVVQLVQTPVGR